MTVDPEMLAQAIRGGVVIARMTTAEKAEEGISLTAQEVIDALFLLRMARRT